MNEEPREGLDVGDSISDEPSPDAAQEAWEGEGGSDGEKQDPLLEQAKAAWEEEQPENQADPDAEAQGGVMVGLSPLGPVVQVTPPGGGQPAQKVVSVEELFLLGGQMIGIASFVMQMGMQAQMQEQARLQQMMQQGEEQTKSGLYVKKR